MFERNARLSHFSETALPQQLQEIEIVDAVLAEARNRRRWRRDASTFLEIRISARVQILLGHFVQRERRIVAVICGRIAILQ